MRRWNATMAVLSTASLGLLLSGCGGDSGDEMVVDMNDPAFSGPPGGGGAPGPAPAQAPGPAPGQAGAQDQAQAPGPPGGAAPRNGGAAGSPLALPRGGDQEEESADSGLVAGAPNRAGRTSSQGGSGSGSGDLALNEMLAAANSANQPPDENAGQGGGAPGPGGGMPGGYAGAMMPPGMAPPGMGPGYEEAYAGNPAGAGYSEQMEASMMPGGYGPGGPGAPPGTAGRGGAGAMPGGPGYGGYGGPGGNPRAEDDDLSRRPTDAVEAFLSAAEDRDPERLQEATALRAPYEAESEHNRKIFQAIREMSLSPEELDQIASSLEGFQISGVNQVRSSGTLSYSLQKQSEESNSTLRRRITLRKEKDGWKVKDLSGVAEIKQFGSRYRRDR